MLKKSLQFLVLILFLIPVKSFSQQVNQALNYNITIDAANVLNNGIKGQTEIIVEKNDTSNKLNLDLLGFTVDSVWINQQNAIFIHNSPSLSVDLPINTPDTFTVTVFYHGAPQKDATWGGFYVEGNFAFNLGVGFSSTPHNLGKAWFPCFDNFTDRALYRFNITTQSTYSAVCNGTLIADSALQNGNHIWHWQLAHPIPTYLAGIAIGKYVFVKTEYNGLNGNIPIVLAAEAKDTVKLKQSFQNLSSALTCFENKFGAYPFEKVGYVIVPFNGGAMEHATSIAYPYYAIDGSTNFETLMAHELSHQWWGNATTCETAEDMWLNEGWASYCESIFLECLYGKPAMVADLQAKLADVLVNAPTSDNGYKSVANMDEAHTYGTHVYKKGALMAHVLRTIMGDSAFFVACKSYLNKYKFMSVNTSNLKEEFQKHTSVSLNDFFDQYILKKGHYDIIVLQSHTDSSGNILTLDLLELNRYKTKTNETSKVKVNVFFKDKTNQTIEAILNQGKGSVNVNIPISKDYSYALIDEDNNYALAHTSEKVTLTKKGVTVVDNAKVSLNVQNITDTVQLTIQHHWVGPTQGDARERGLRISKERYWSVYGAMPIPFTCWAFFAYDGSSSAFLDEELFNSITTEDSLVLLYRKNENMQWRVLSNTEAVFQPGGNPNDWLGRFWVSKLQTGDYVLGAYDQSVVGISNKMAESFDGKIWPNPANDFFTLQLNNDNLLNAKIDIVNALGKTVSTVEINENTKSIVIDTKQLNSGIYHILIQTENKKYATKFLKK